VKWDALRTSQRLQREQDFNPQLAVNLMKVLELNGDYQELQRLLTRIIKWLEQDFKQRPKTGHKRATRQL